MATRGGTLQVDPLKNSEGALALSSPDQLYLDLVKRAVAFTLWDEPPAPISMVRYRRSFVKRHLVAALTKLAATWKWQIVEHRGYSDVERQEGQLWPMYAHTMIGMKRLDNLQFCVEDALARGVPGDLIETGVWRGGACILMRAILAAHGVTNRRVFVADSFQGLPEPDNRYPQDAGAGFHTQSFLAVSRADVEESFRRFGLLDSQVVFLEGWFKDTLPRAPIDQVAVMRLDGDMYASTMDALNALYSKLAAGGYCIIDDYALEGARQATDDFRKQHMIRSELKQVDFTGVYWRKDA